MDDDTQRMAGSHRQFDVLVVCTANLCRSPMIEALLRAGLAGSASAWSVTSAGTHAGDGRPVHPFTAQALADHDLTLPPGWASRQLLPEHVERADLVLTAARSHRSDVVRTLPTASARVFTVRQFLRLLHTPGAEDPGPWFGHAGDRLLETALSARGLGPPAPPTADDIPDPVGHPYRVFRALADDLSLELRAFTGPTESTRPRVPALRPVGAGRLTAWRASRSS